MNGSSRFVVTLTDGNRCACILFNKETAAKLSAACRAFTFDARVHYRKNLSKFRKRISALQRGNADNEGLRKLSSFLSVVPASDYFAVCGGDIAGSRLFLQIVGNLSLRNGREYLPGREEKFRALSNYGFISAGTVVRKAGPVPVARRRCRYCGGSVPATTFLSKAHTISEALGNKTLYTNDECDGCNARFARKIEAQFVNRLSPWFPVLDLAGKNGGRKIKGKYYSLERDTDPGKKRQIVIHLSDYTLARYGAPNISDIELRTTSPARAWVPQNVYRLLCKFVIGTLDSRLLRYFRCTVEWINGRNLRTPLPVVCLEHLAHTVQQPVVYIYRRQQNRDCEPYMFARIHILTCAYTFIMPFCSLDVDGLNHDGFMKKVTGLVPSVRTQWLDLNSRKPVTPEVMARFTSGDHHVCCDPEQRECGRWYRES